MNSVPSRVYPSEVIEIPEDIAPGVGGAADKKVSTQAAFGEVLFDLAKSEHQLADRILTAAPDVTSTTNLTAFVNRRAIFSENKKMDNWKQAKMQSMNNWKKASTGQHIELGIAEMNLAILLASAGLSSEMFGHRLFPIGTLYDPFVARALDAIHYGCYMNSRFMLVGTPSGISLSPEGGAHQSIGTPLMGMSTPNLLVYEPAYADEVKTCMHEGFHHMQRPLEEGGGAVYLRLSTRALEQPVRDLQGDPELRESVIKGGYWHVAPTSETTSVIIFCGVVAGEARAAQMKLGASTALLQVTSYDKLFADWKDDGPSSHVAQLLAGVPRAAPLVTVMDGHPATLSWMGGVQGHRVSPLGVQTFGQAGDVIDLYSYYGIDTPAIVEACTSHLT